LPRSLRAAVIEPFREFISRAGLRSALVMLAFMVLYKLGDSMATALATPFYLDMGFTKTEIGLIAKHAGLWPSVIGGLLGGLWMLKLGINRALWLFGVVQVVSILGFAVLTEFPRDRLMLAFSHTHGGPSVTNLLQVLANPRMTPDQQRDMDDYTRGLVDKVVALVGEALADLRPARLSAGQGEAPFAMNRRLKTEKGYVIGVNPDGPTDHTVPVLRVDGADGRLRAVVFLYACHNTTLGGDIYQFHGDYAGFAESALESRHAGATAMFMMGCGGDANPHLRGTLDLARQHGETLAGAVDAVLGGAMRPVPGPLRSAFKTVALPFAPPPAREVLEAQTPDKNQFV
jgi:hypothetical protein